MVDEELSLQHDRKLIEGGGLEGLIPSSRRHHHGYRNTNIPRRWQADELLDGFPARNRNRNGLCD